jgi:hypothetical protein
MKHESKFNSSEQDQQQSQADLHGQQQTNGLEFANVEEMFRHDALHTPVPPAIEVRLQKSIEEIPTPRPSSWWKRMLGS